MTERVQKAIDTLLDAINNRTLGKGSCTACAVGNLVAKGLNYEITDISDVNPIIGGWARAFYTVGTYQHKQSSSYDSPEVVKCVQSTDFTLEELMEIEYAFETNTKINHTQYTSTSDKQVLRDQIKGLEAVIKVMMEFDEVEADIQQVFTDKVLVVN